MQKEIRLIKSLYKKEAILYTINLYLEDYNYSIDENEKEFVITVENLDEKTFKQFLSEMNFNTLRFEIADNNKELRKIIISKALWSINIE